MPTVFVGDRHFDPHSGDPTGFDLTVQYGGPQIQVSVLGISPLSEPEQDAGIRTEILHLGQAIVQAAQSPQGIVSLPRPPGGR